MVRFVSSVASIQWFKVEKRVKEIRIAVIATGVALGSLIPQLISRPVYAAQPGWQTETAKTADVHQDPGAAAYAKNCAVCHGAQRQGNPPTVPSLIDIGHRMPEDKIADLIHTGKGGMPAFANLQGGELTALLHFLTTSEQPSQAGAAGVAHPASDLVESGGALFGQNCAFCHGRDAMGGETGPDLTESTLVQSDTTGEKIAEVIRDGRPDGKMPAFKFSPQQINSLIAFIRSREAAAKAHPGGRRGVSVEDLQTGNAQAGKQYFEGAGGCVKCHSATGDLAGVADRYKGLKLEEQMLYPRNAKSTITVTLPSGEKISGTLAYRDEFTVGLRDSNGIYRSWPTNRVKFTIKSPADAHAEQLPKYTDDDVHNLMAYLQTLK